MADIAELIDEVANPDLRERLVREVKHLKATKRLGLVCERHFPEPVLLAGQPVRPGSSVRLRTEPDEEYEVSAVDGPTATIVPVENSRAGGGGPANLRPRPLPCWPSRASRSRSIRV